MRSPGDRDVRLTAIQITTLRDLVLLQLAERGVAPAGTELTGARSHIQQQSVEELNDLRDRLGEGL